MPEYVFARRLVSILTGIGKEAYIAGGFCRDLLLGRPSKDIDVATSCSPQDVMDVLDLQGISSSPVDAAEAYPVVIAREHGLTVEVATFRKDLYEGRYGSRRPRRIEPGTLQEDAQRRDFTANALYLDPLSEEMLDPLGQGKDDIRSGTIRFIGDPAVRIMEDRLRILRAVRFKNRLRFSYDPDTYAALVGAANEVLRISPERVREELTALLTDPSRTAAVQDLERLGLLSLLLPEVEGLIGVAQPSQFHSEGDVFTHTGIVLQNLPDTIPPALAWAALLHDIGKPATFSYRPGDRIRFNNHDRVGTRIADDILKRYRFSRKSREAILWLIANHMQIRDLPVMGRGKQLGLVTHPHFEELLLLLRADNASSIRPDGSTDMAAVEEVQRIYDQYKDQDITSLPDIKHDLGISGSMLITRYHIDTSKPDARQLKRLGKLLEYLQDEYLDGTIMTGPDALEKADRWWSGGEGH